MMHRSVLFYTPMALVLGWGAAGMAQSPGKATQARDFINEIDVPTDLPEERLLWHIPDPESERDRGLKELAEAEEAGDTARVQLLKRIFQRVESIRRPEQLRLTLEDALQRALANSFAIDIQRYNPAIETTRVVEAEAAFDAVFFSDITRNKVDQPTSSQLQANQADQFSSSYGVRKLLPTGAQITGSYSLDRTKTSLSFQDLNPAYTSGLTLEVRQPLLRGFGIDFNRSIININKNNQKISTLTFERQVEDTLNQVEQSYWQLVQARRDIVITARLLAEFEAIYEYLVARQEFDATPVQLNTTLANLQQSRVEFIQKRATVRDAEDRLIAAMNDKDINLADDIEIVPESMPEITRIVVNRLAEVSTALEQRPEIRERQLAVKNAELALGQAKNQELPRLDVNLTYNIQGLAGNADRSFDEASRHKYVTYVTGLQLEMPIGNRAARAAHLRARLELLQAKAAQRLEIERAILEVNEAVRTLDTRYDQLAPTFQTAEARFREVESIVARAERKDYNTLNLELGARRSLADARRFMIAAMVDYNIAVINLEQAKGTLLPYNNVVLSTDVE